MLKSSRPKLCYFASDCDIDDYDANDDDDDPNYDDDDDPIVGDDDDAANSAARPKEIEGSTRERLAVSDNDDDEDDNDDNSDADDGNADDYNKPSNSKGKSDIIVIMRMTRMVS